MQAAVHARHLEFVFEVRHRTQAAHDHARIALAQEIHQQAVEADHLDVRQIVGQRARDFDALLQWKDRALAAACGDADDDMGEQTRGAAHQILVAPREGVEGARIDGNAVVHVRSSK